MAMWRIKDNLGSGKFGVVFACQRGDEAHDAHPDDWSFALKRLQTDWLTNDEARARFKRETDIQSSLAHENVIPVVEAGESAKKGPWFVMPRATHGSLKDAISDGRAADPDWALRIFAGVLAGVAHAHEQGILHRDVKPGNILLFGECPRIADFGIARQIDSDGTTLTHTAEQLGTFRYMAPEQLEDVKRVTPAADVYSLGKVLCHLLSGITPEPFKISLHGIPPEYRHFIDKCCRDDPKQRFEDAGAALTRFSAIGAPLEVILPPLEQGQELAGIAEAAIGTNEQRAAVEALETHFQHYSTERALFMDVLPGMSEGLITAWLEQRLDGFAQVIAGYETMIAGSNLNFGYCDVIGRFYRTIFEATEDVGLKRLVLTRLVVMGHTYNRFFVHDLVVEMLKDDLTDQCDVEIAEEVIQQNREAASWYAATALKSSLPAPVASALRIAKEEPDVVI